MYATLGHLDPDRKRRLHILQRKWRTERIPHARLRTLRILRRLEPQLIIARTIRRGVDTVELICRVHVHVFLVFGEEVLEAEDVGGVVLDGFHGVVAAEEDAAAGSAGVTLNVVGDYIVSLVTDAVGWDFAVGGEDLPGSPIIKKKIAVYDVGAALTR